jgi:hypothetical protein
MARFITQYDEQTYGPELIDVMRRGAREAVGPELEALHRRH